MNRLIQTSSFEVLSSGDSTESQIRLATQSLLNEIVALSISEANCISLFRILHYTRFHLRTMEENPDVRTEKGKKCIRTALCY